MHIKQIIIQGFKSYKEQTVIEPFSPKSNVVVGRNGSGKSNFFAAVRFVLGDDYSHLGREERGALLHEGSGSAVMSAYVEVIFDNSDDRFPTGKSELILRRTIGVKKDEYTLDRKNATKTDVMNLLESAGFSRANPYYIVPQGRVTKLTNMDEAARLNLLKDVAGTQVYEARRAESLKIIADTDNKRAKIDDLLEYIQERLAQLEEEKEELRKYQDKDREHRSLQYTILVRSQQEYQSRLERIDEQRSAGVEETDERQQAVQEAQERVRRLREQISQASQQIEFLRLDRRQLEDERKELAKQKAKAELDVRAATEGQAVDQQAAKRRATDLRNVKKAIQERQAELKQIDPQYTKAKQQEDAIRQQISDARNIIERIRSKQGRSAQYKTKKERDAALTRLVDSINAQLAVLKANSMQNTEEVSEVEQDIERLQTEVQQLRDRLEGRDDDNQDINAAIEQAKDRKDQLIDQRKELWREQSKLEPVIAHTQNELRSAEDLLSRMADRSTWQGIKAVRRIKEQYNLDGVYGMLGELFEVNERYQLAVEVTAGKSLFHWVVDTDETATRVIEILNKEKAGRVSFMPLNRLHPKTTSIPKASDAVHMLSKIEYDETYAKAFEQTFGKTIICPTLTIASQYARSHGVSAITVDGDRADRKGALTGGYHDSSKSRLDAIGRENKWRSEYESHVAKRTEIRSSLERLDQEITRAMSDVQKAEQRRYQRENNVSRAADDARSRSQELSSKRDQLDRLQRAKASIDKEERRLGQQQTYYEAEMNSAFQKALSNTEEQELATNSSSLPTLQAQLNPLVKTRSDLEARKSAIEIELQENLQPTLDQLTAQLSENGQGEGGSGVATQLKEKQRSLEKLDTKLTALIENINASDSSIEEASNNLTQYQTQQTTEETQLAELSRRIERHQRDVVKNMEDRRRYAERLAETNAQIRDLGVLPEEAFEKYMKLDLNKAMDRMAKAKEALKKFSGVNKKAFEQYNNFTRQRETLTDRRKELESSKESIESLIEHLDQKKDEAIERTFKQVSREFANVFEKLVPAGKGRLVIVRKTDRPADGAESEEERPRGDGSIENYKGVGIKVSFNSKHDEQQRIQQLSGGQKSKSPSPLFIPPLSPPLTPSPPRSMRPRPSLRNPTMRPRPLLLV